MLKLNRLKYFIGVLGFSILSIFPVLSFAWGWTGHVVIAQIAYNNLTPAAKLKADNLANIIYEHLPTYEQEKLDRNYSNASTFAKIALLPDVWRKWHLGTIFTANDALPPLSMILYSASSTEAWHFINLPYPASSSCNEIQPENVAWAISKIETAFPTTKMTNTQAVLMVLEEHYIGDIYQPLHTISRVDSLCNNDEGGNEFCIRYGEGSRCSKSLHALWDSGVGYLRPKENILSLAYELQQLNPKNTFSTKLVDNNPMDWAKDNYAYADFIYSLEEGEKPTPDYYQQGQFIAKKQLALAGYRLAEVLNAQLADAK